MKAGGKLARFLTKGDIEKIRNSSKSANSPAWRNWWGEMARKCALKRTLKDAPLSTEKFVKAMEFESDDLTDVLAAATGAGHARGVAALAKRLTNRPVSEGQTFEPAPEAMDIPSHDEAEQIINNAPARPRPSRSSRSPTPAASKLKHRTDPDHVRRIHRQGRGHRQGPRSSPDVFDAAAGKLKLSNGGGKRADAEARADVIAGDAGRPVRLEDGQDR
jgi:hypothetical protein